jgi:hypothetical protein
MRMREAGFSREFTLERSSALQRATLALVVPSRKGRFAPAELQFLTRTTYHRAKLFESDRPA